ncbi:MAG TPA: hypothetical protein VFP52_10095, partial [Myxococcales bacterium]|nr:hypothetical protein [Myxococcales bacterium]
GANMTLMEVNQACSLIQEAAHEDANIIFGSVIDDEMGEELKITVIATGFASRDARRIERMDATRGVRPNQGTLAMPLPATDPGGVRHHAAHRTPEIRAATPPPGANRATPPPGANRATPPPAARPQGERPVRHISWDELRQMTGATEDELDVPTFLRNGE